MARSTPTEKRRVSGSKGPSPKSTGARPRLVPGYTASPTVPGARENISRVYDPLEAMRKRGQIGKVEYEAAVHIRAANDVIYGSPGGVMDLDRVRGGGSSGPQAAPPYLEAAETLRLIKRCLYPMDHRLIELVVIAGYSIVDAARTLHGRVPSRGEKEEAGARLRIGLREVAEKLWGSGIHRQEDRPIVASHAAGATEYTAAPGLIGRAKTVHATGRRIFRSK